MLKSEKIVVKTNNHKKEAFSKVPDYVRFLVRYTEYNRIAESKQWTELVSKLHTANPLCKWETVTEEEAKAYLCDEDRVLFLQKRAELHAIQEDMDTLDVSYSDYNALGSTDKVFITLQAHTALRTVKLPDSIVSGLDLEKSIEGYFTTGSLSGIKDLFKSIFNRILGEEGELFYGVKLKKSDFDSEDLRTCLSYFRGQATRNKAGKYVWDNKDYDVKAQTMALTNLFAVVLDSSKNYTILKPGA